MQSNNVRSNLLYYLKECSEQILTTIRMFCVELISSICEVKADEFSLPEASKLKI